MASTTSISTPTIGRVKRRRLVGRVGLLLALACGVAPAMTAPAHAAVAAGCTADRPTSIGGTIAAWGGKYDNWTVNAGVGIDLVDANGKSVNPDGTVNTRGTYGAVDWVNPTLAVPGQATGGERTWGLSGSTGALCVASNVQRVYLEVYPKRPGGITDKTYMGGSQHHAWMLTVGAINTYALRLPVNTSTGGYNGYITDHGHKLNLGKQAGQQRLTVRTWSNEGTCGVFGFSAAADQLGPSASRDADYYAVDHLAGGQCGAASQTYRSIVSLCTWTAQSSGALTCEGNRTITKTVRITAGQRVGAVDFAF
jgi:hypothetical protein